MDDARRKKYEQALEFFGQPPHYSSDQLMVAICLTQLGKYPNAQHFYDLALEGFLKDRRAWHGSSQPNWLVDTYVLANRPGLYSQVREEIEAYRQDRRGGSLVALYSYALVRLVSDEDRDADDYVPGLLKDPKIKWTFGMGKTIKAIIERDQQAFDAALDGLLKAHRGMAKFGGLRETPEGFLCLPAMSLSKMALERGMKINSESEYLSKGYLEYLSQQQDPAF
jgi:tetratricopeptide (TPR) repeat protein